MRLMFVIDARVGLTPNDRAFADFARRANKPVVLVANKAEGKHGEIGAMESYALGLGDPIQISAEHGEGLSDLYDALRALMPEPVDEQEEFDDDDIIETGRGACEATDSRRHRRPPERRQVDADQSSARRRAAVDQRRGRHHPRFHFRRDHLAGPRISRVRHRGPSAALADRGEAGKAVGGGRVARGALRRSRGADDGLAEQVRGTGSADRRPDRARGPRARDRRQQMGLDGTAVEPGFGAAHRRRSPAAAGQGRARSSRCPA